MPSQRKRECFHGVPCGGQISSSGAVNGVVNLWCQDAEIPARFRIPAAWLECWSGWHLSMCHHVCGHHWEKLNHKEGMSREKLKTGSQEEEGIEVRAVTFPALPGRRCGWTLMADELRGWTCSENLRETDLKQTATSANKII